MHRVSICLPNLNTAKYLPERLDSVIGQKFQDWELIVSDNFSTDGSWEILQRYAKRDGRIKLLQAARDPLGMYPNWNNCICRATGEFIYIATSDDTMRSECLEKMVAALDEHAECGLCQCALEIIDENGLPHADMDWKYFSLNRFAPEWMKQRHVRLAPMDGILHSALQTVYTSITQLLIRRSVFDRYGLFKHEWGSAADFEWGMRVGFLENVVFIPEYLATWRVHPDQATGTTESECNRRSLHAMAESAYREALALDPTLAERLAPLGDTLLFYKEQVVHFGLKERATTWSRAVFLLLELLRGNPFAKQNFCRWMRSPFSEKAQFRKLRVLLDKYGLDFTQARSP
jgi:glycosyltransferase involved in cell wall biosynthesis